MALTRPLQSVYFVGNIKTQEQHKKTSNLNHRAIVSDVILYYVDSLILTRLCLESGCHDIDIKWPQIVCERYSSEVEYSEKFMISQITKSLGGKSSDELMQFR